jgi:6-pyruvoyltetrahydropterin/6-carboxytetrahydropterin synthase
VKVRVEDVFDAATALPGHDRCNGLHGHTYKVEAIVDGPLVGGVVADFREVKARLHEVIKPFDHTDVSLQFAYPSCETLIIDICKRLKPAMPGLEMVRLWEGEGKWIELDAADLESLLP